MSSDPQLDLHLDRRDEPNFGLPVTPYYQGTSSGYSGTDTSRERAEREDTGGVTQKRQREVLVLLRRAGARGMTVADLRDLTGYHHGQVSSALSNLHYSERIVMLTERRDKCHVYVLPEHVGDRPTRPHGRNKPKVEPTALVDDATYAALLEVAVRQLAEVKKAVDTWTDFYSRNKGFDVADVMLEAADEIRKILEARDA